MATQWQLRYRSPIAPTKAVDDVIIETEGDSEAEARVLADWWLATYVPHQATRFVYVRRLVVATSAMMRAAQTGASPPEGTRDDARRPARPGATPLGRVGA